MQALKIWKTGLMIAAYIITISSMILLGLYCDTKISPTSESATSPTCLSACMTNLSTSPTSPCSRGEKLKVVSFSFYGDLKSVYYSGIRDNLEGMKVFYKLLLNFSWFRCFQLPDILPWLGYEALY